MNADVILEKENHIAILTLNRPDKLNAITWEMQDTIASTIEDIEKDNQVRALIITGAGSGFCSGSDVVSQLKRKEDQTWAPTRQTALKLVGEFVLCFSKTSKPIIAAINGIAAGVGLTITLACDIRLASVNARFSAIWVKRALIPDGGATYLLPKIVGLDNALKLSYTGKIIDATEAQRINLVTDVVPAEELLTQAKDLAEEIAEMPPVTVGCIKNIMWEEIRASTRKALFTESYGQNLVRNTNDNQEAMNAFLEKRKPQFKGC